MNKSIKSGERLLFSLGLVFIFKCVQLECAEHIEFHYSDQNEWPMQGFSTCSPENTRQSPINIDTNSLVPSSEMTFNLLSSYKDQAVIAAINTNHTVNLKFNYMKDAHGNVHTPQIELKTPDMDSPTTYSLRDLHFHWGSPYGSIDGSEHTVDNMAYDAEMHFVHFNDAIPKESVMYNGNGLTVIGVFIRVGRWNANMDDLLSCIQEVDASSRVTLCSDYEGTVADLLPKSLTCYFYNYKGSLTTPPCNEIVNWIVAGEPIEMSYDQLTVLKNFRQVSGSLIGRNVRDVQAVFDRQVYIPSTCPSSQTPSNNPSDQVDNQQSLLGRFSSRLRQVVNLRQFLPSSG